MATRIPLNQIIYKYTSGGEYIVENTNINYKGYYYEVNGKAFIGENFNPTASILIPIPKNSTESLPGSLFTRSTNFIYGQITNINFPIDLNLKSIPIVFDSLNPTEKIMYFSKKNNTNPIKIIRISKEDYLKGVNSKNPLYSFTAVEFDIEFGFSITDQNKKDIPEIDDFLRRFSNEPNP